MGKQRDWADVEDHDFLNEFVGCRIDRIETGTDRDPFLTVHTSRGRSLRITAEPHDHDHAGLTIEEP